MYAERIFKFLLWQRGGWKVCVGGPKSIGDYIRECYSPGGVQEFDYHFMMDAALGSTWGLRTARFRR